jgi:peptidoglycan/LPS O-acetylase OafA/YrhL
LAEAELAGKFVPVSIDSFLIVNERARSFFKYLEAEVMPVRSFARRRESRRTAPEEAAVTTSAPRAEPRRLEALDGLRGAAILLVMIYHFTDIPQVSGLAVDHLYYLTAMLGWTGVDLFFVLSGFLITRILLASKAHGTRYFSTFYARRALRIFPVYYAFLIVFSAALAVLGPTLDVAPQKLAAFGEGSIWLWLYASNLHALATNAHVGLATGHFWSLAVEEQFYLAWPLIVWLLSPRALFRAALVAIVAAPVVRAGLWTAGYAPVPIYTFTLSHMDALTAGAIGAVVMHTGVTDIHRKIATAVLGVAGGWAAVLLALFGPRPDIHPAMYTIASTPLALSFGAAVFLVAARYEASSAGGILGSAFLRFFGKYSYTLYIVHPALRALMAHFFPEPVLLFGSQLPWQALFIVVCGGMSVAIAFASWHLFEKRVLSLKRLFSYGPTTIRQLDAAVPASADLSADFSAPARSRA